jgi:outer membrane protein assembly factor BamB
MKTTVTKGISVLAFVIIAICSPAQTLNIGNFTALKVSNNVIYVAGQSGIAALKPDLTVLWEKQLPETSIRLLEANDQMIAFSNYTYDGRKGQLFSSFSLLWDKVTYSGNAVGALDLGGQLLWTTNLWGNSKLSAPALGEGIIAVSSNDSLYTLTKANGQIKTQTYNNEKFILGKSIKDHATPNQPLIAKGAIYTAAPFKFTKIDFNGKIVEEKKMYGMMAPLPVMTVAPIVFDNKIFVSNAPTGHSGQKDGVARLYCVKDDLDKDWDEFVDVDGQTGVSSLIHNNNSVIVATNFDVMAFNAKGKKLWENGKKIGLPVLRGVRYPSASFGGTMGVKTSTGNFLCADDNAVYLASGEKIKKEFKPNIMVIDAEKGKFVKSIDVPDPIVDMGLTDNSLIVITESNKVLVIGK